MTYEMPQDLFTRMRRSRRTFWCEDLLVSESWAAWLAEDVFPVPQVQTILFFGEELGLGWHGLLLDIE
jgi:hypothetical protein